MGALIYPSTPRRIFFIGERLIVIHEKHKVLFEFFRVIDPSTYSRGNCGQRPNLQLP